MLSNQVFVSVSGDKTVRIWKIRTNFCVQKLNGHNKAVNSGKFNFGVSIFSTNLFFFFKSDKIVSLDYDGITKIWTFEWLSRFLGILSIRSANCAVLDRSGTFV